MMVSGMTIVLERGEERREMMKAYKRWGEVEKKEGDWNVERKDKEGKRGRIRKEGRKGGKGKENTKGEREVNEEIGKNEGWKEGKGGDREDGRRWDERKDDTYEMCFLWGVMCFLWLYTTLIVARHLRNSIKI